MFRVGAASGVPRRVDPDRPGADDVFPAFYSTETNRFMKPICLIVKSDGREPKSDSFSSSSKYTFSTRRRHRHSATLIRRSPSTILLELLYYHFHGNLMHMVD